MLKAKELQKVWIPGHRDPWVSPWKLPPLYHVVKSQGMCILAGSACIIFGHEASETSFYLQSELVKMVFQLIRANTWCHGRVVDRILRWLSALESQPSQTSLWKSLFSAHVHEPPTVTALLGRTSLLPISSMPILHPLPWRESFLESNLHLFLHLKSCSFSSVSRLLGTRGQLFQAYLITFT